MTRTPDRHRPRRPHRWSAGGPIAWRSAPRLLPLGPDTSVVETADVRASPGPPGRPRPVGGRRWRRIGSAARPPGARFAVLVGGRTSRVGICTPRPSPRYGQRAVPAGRVNLVAEPSRSFIESISGSFGGPVASANGGDARRSQRGGGRPACPPTSLFQNRRSTASRVMSLTD